MIYHTFFRIISIIIAASFLLLGIVGMLMPWIAIIRTEIIRFILEDSITIFLFGFALFIAGLLILINILLNTRRRYYFIRGGKKSIVLDEAVINGYLNTYWKELFPQEEIPHRTIIKNNRLYLFVDLPFIPESQQKTFTQRIQQDVEELLDTNLGYSHSFYMTVSFKKE